MYAPKQFREERREVLLSAIGSIRLAALVASSEHSLDAAHLPMIAREEGDALLIEGHVARGNPLWRMIGDGVPALAIFQGPQAYVHPGWLATKRETGKAVPTWNYVAIHAHGHVAINDDPAWLLRHVEELTRLTEAGRPEPWALSDAPDGYIDQLVRGIVGLTLKVARLEGVWKMIQHHPEANRAGVIEGLASTRELDAMAVADVMRDLEHGRAAR